MKTPPPTGPTYPNDSAAGISALLRTASGGIPPPPPRLPPAPPAPMDDDDNLRRQSMEALCKAMLVCEERTATLAAAMKALSEKVSVTIDDRMTVNIDRLETTLRRVVEDQTSAPIPDDSHVRYLVHIYGMVILGTIFVATIFLLLRR